MICPQCGYEMGSSHKCLRCGYEVKTLVTVDEKEQTKENKSKEEEPVTKVIDPDKVYISNADDGFDDGFDDPFSMLFGDIFDPIGSLLGGLFGFDAHSSHSSYDRIQEQQPEQKKDKNKVVEVKKVEIYDENGNPVKQDSKLKQTVNKVKNKVKNKMHGNN